MFEDIAIRGAGGRRAGISSLSRQEKRSGERQWRVHKPRWVDPYPWVMGSIPEKLVFAWLMNRGVFFTFQSEFSYEYGGEWYNYRLDFLLNTLDVVIEVQGDYWHSLPGQAADDAEKFAILELAGYKVYWIWASDVLVDLSQQMFGIQELQGYAGPAGFEWESQQDDLAGLRAANAGSRGMPTGELTRRS